MLNLRFFCLIAEEKYVFGKLSKKGKEYLMKNCREILI